MRKIYLIRHGKPNFPAGSSMCLGRTELPLGAVGRMQAALLGAELVEDLIFSLDSQHFRIPLLSCGNPT